MKNYGRFFNERNEKHKLTAVILLTAGIITFVAVLHTVRVIIRESGGALERDVQIVASLFSLCGIILLTALILFFVWNVRIAAKFEICRMGAELDREKIANQAKSDFLSGMSHELRTPMNAIVGLTTLARRSVGDEQKTTMYLRKLEISTSYMLSLINDILEMSRIERGKMTLYQIPFDFYEVVEAVDAMMCQISGEKQQHFEMDIRVEHHQIIGDKVRLQQIIINLLNNAVKYTGTGGRIRLEIEERKMEDGKVWLYVEVSDTGIGIRPEDQERIFEPFEEAEGKERGGAALEFRKWIRHIFLSGFTGWTSLIREKSEEQVWDSVSAAIFSVGWAARFTCRVCRIKDLFFLLKRHLNVRRANFFRRMKSRRGPGI